MMTALRHASVLPTVMLVFLGVLGVPQQAVATSIVLAPVYSTSQADDVTGNNCAGMTKSQGCTANGWSVTPLADVYSQDRYERPTSQTFISSGGDIVATEYLGYLDLIGGQYGFSDTYLFFQLNLFSPYLYKADGTVDTGVFGSGTQYGVQLGVGGDPGTLLLRGEQDTSTVNNPLFTSEKTQVWFDSNNDVGGPGGVAVPNEGVIDGYDSLISLSSLLFSRSFYNLDGTASVELAFNYALYNEFCATGSCTSVDPAALLLVFETMRGIKDNQNYLWNDKYNASEAGTPYTTAGLGNIYENDNLRVGATVPEPGTLALLGLGVMGLAARRRRSSRRS